MSILINHDKVVCDWAGKQFGAPIPPGCTAWGITDTDGLLVGAIIYFNHHKHGNIEMAMIGQVVRKDTLRRIARYVFGQLGCTRLTARTARSNIRARRMLPRAGFTFEGTNARWYGPERKSDALVFGLFAENAKRWL